MSSRKDAIQRFFRAHLKLFAGLFLVVFTVSLTVGSVLLYRYRTGPDFAVKSLRDALVKGDKARLAARMDFRSLSEDIALAVLAVYPQHSTANEVQKAEMRDEAQRQALKALAVEKDAKPEIVLPRKLFEAVPFVPVDVVVQLAAEMTLEKTSGEAQIRSSFTHHELQKDFPVRLLMEHRQGGWLVTHLLNAQDLVKLYKEATDALRAEDEAKLTETNKKITDRMRAHFHAPQCQVAAQLVSNAQEVRLVARVTANNKDTTTLHNVNLLLDVHANNGATVYSRRLNVVQQVYSGGTFSNTWTILLDADNEDAAKLLQAGPLSCTVEPKVMSVGMGEMLFPRTD